MKRIFLFLSLITLTMFGLQSCESVNEAQAAADEFYAALKANDYEKASTFFDQTMFDRYGKDKIIELLQQHNADWPGIRSYSKYGFDTRTNNGVTVVQLKFKVETEKGLVFEKLEFIKRGEEYLLDGFFFNPVQSEVDAV
jgi:hypothetical protein